MKKNLKSGLDTKTDLKYNTTRYTRLEPLRDT